MATKTRVLDEPANLDDSSTDRMVEWDDRPWLRGDFHVMISGQTFEAYVHRAPENQVCEFIDEVVYMPSPASHRHQFEVLLLSFLLRGFLAKRPVGRLLSGPACLRAGADRYLEPDLFVIPHDPVRQLTGFSVEPPILLVIEVLSPLTRSHDLDRKLRLYQELEVEEIWSVDDRDHVMILHRRMIDGDQVDRLAEGSCPCLSLPGFWIDVDWPWARPEPDGVECLQAILDGPPT